MRFCNMSTVRKVGLKKLTPAIKKCRMCLFIYGYITQAGQLCVSSIFVTTNKTDLSGLVWCVGANAINHSFILGLARLLLASKLTKGGVYLQAVGDNRAHRLLPAALALQPH